MRVEHVVLGLPRGGFFHALLLLSAGDHPIAAGAAVGLGGPGGVLAPLAGAHHPGTIRLGRSSLGTSTESTASIIP